MSTRERLVRMSATFDDQPVLRLDLACHSTIKIITVAGEIDMDTGHLLTELADHLARVKPTRVVLDMSQVSFFCADGIRVLMTARNALAAAGAHLTLFAPSAATWRVLTITGADRLFSIDHDLAPGSDADEPTGRPDWYQTTVRPTLTRQPHDP